MPYRPARFLRQLAGAVPNCAENQRVKALAAGRGLRGAFQQRHAGAELHFAGRGLSGRFGRSVSAWRALHN